MIETFIIVLVSVKLVQWIFTRTRKNRKPKRKQKRWQQQRKPEMAACYYITAADPQQIRTARQAEKENERIARQQEKERLARQKEAIQAEKARQRKEQAEADNQFYQQQQETIIDMLNTIDTELVSINWNIEIDQKLRSLDSLKRHEKQRETLVKKKMQLENRLHTLESKMAKCYYIINS